MTCDVPDYSLMLGVPAQQKGWVCACGELLHENLECKKCVRKYEARKNGIVSF
ncbi:hypothetical protein [Lachnobacterium bovis]|uniref:hypothetical protein n=1 Tax=Lachnobacterium bovis TaxID=140626 RepID=UPI0015A530C4|nr:hypothetical protein [Lachnobacterium bovis]